MNKQCPKCGHNPATDHIRLKEQLAQAREENDALKLQRSLEADVLNTELRENYGGAHQVSLEQDWRLAIRLLVDGVRYGERFRWQHESTELKKEKQWRG